MHKLMMDDALEVFDEVGDLSETLPVVSGSIVYCLHCGGSFEQGDVMVDAEDGLLVCPVEGCDGSSLDFSLQPWPEVTNLIDWEPWQWYWYALRDAQRTARDSFHERLLCEVGRLLTDYAVMNGRKVTRRILEVLAEEDAPE